MWDSPHFSAESLLEAMLGRLRVGNTNLNEDCDAAFVKYGIEGLQEKLEIVQEALELLRAERIDSLKQRAHDIFDGFFYEIDKLKHFRKEDILAITRANVRRYLDAAPAAYTQLFRAYGINEEGRTIAFTPGVVSTGFARVVEMMGAKAEILPPEDMRVLREGTSEEVKNLLREMANQNLCISEDEVQNLGRPVEILIPAFKINLIVIDRNAVSQEIGTYLQQMGIRGLSEDVINAAEEARKLYEAAIEIGL